MPEHRIDLSGDYNTSIYDCAYVLFMAGVDPEDAITTVRDETASQTGTVARLAPFYVSEGDRAGLRLQRRKCAIGPNGKWMESGGVPDRVTQKIVAQLFAILLTAAGLLWAPAGQAAPSLSACVICEPGEGSGSCERPRQCTLQERKEMLAWAKKNGCFNGSGGMSCYRELKMLGYSPDLNTFLAK